jgi:hypothetical protein
MPKLLIVEMPKGKPNQAAVHPDQKSALRAGCEAIDKRGAVKVTIHDITPKKKQ